MTIVKGTKYKTRKVKVKTAEALSGGIPMVMGPGNIWKQDLPDTETIDDINLMLREEWTLEHKESGKPYPVGSLDVSQLRALCELYTLAGWHIELDTSGHIDATKLRFFPHRIQLAVRFKNGSTVLLSETP